MEHNIMNMRNEYSRIQYSSLCSSHLVFMTIQNRFQTQSISILNSTIIATQITEQKKKTTTTHIFHIHAHWKRRLFFVFFYLKYQQPNRICFACI